MDLGLAVLAAWAVPTGPAAALASRPLAEAVTGIPLPLPVSPDEVERRVAVARRNREYSAAHTDAMLPGDPPILPALLARAEVLDAKERASFADGLAEWERRQDLGPAVVDARDVALAREVRRLVLELPPDGAAVLCLRYGLAGERPRSAEEVARTLLTEAATVRCLEAQALAALRAPDAVAALRGVLDTAAAPLPRPYP